MNLFGVVFLWIFPKVHQQFRDWKKPTFLEILEISTFFPDLEKNETYLRIPHSILV